MWLGYFVLAALGLGGAAVVGIVLWECRLTWRATRHVRIARDRRERGLCWWCGALPGKPHARDCKATAANPGGIREIDL
jgi:hypothetical protein